MGLVVTTFPNEAEAAKALAALEALGLGHEVIYPGAAYSLVGAPAIVMEAETRMALADAGRDVVSSGWVDCHRTPGKVPAESPPSYDEDIFGDAAVMVLARCTADETKIRAIAHISGDIAPVFPYLNAEMKNASYSGGKTFTFMQEYRLISLYAGRIAIAKADDIVDAWRLLEKLRRLTNETWARRAQIVPSYRMWRRPSALEIYKRLPGINCRECNFATCLAFAMRVQLGHAPATLCAPVFSGEYGHLKDALVEICAGTAIDETMSGKGD